MGGVCQVPNIMYTISYAFNITLLIIIIVKDYLSGFISIYVCFLNAPKPRIVILLEGFTNFSVDPQYRGS